MIAILSIFLVVLFAPGHVHSKCIAGELCWPDAQTWASFNRSVGGRMISVAPPASPCHDPNYDERACNAVRSGWNSPFWRTDQPGALQRTSWESFGEQRCLISSNRTAACFQGAVPIYAVNVTRAAHVQEAVKFASRHDLRIVIRNTGHDFLGRSTAVGALSIWVHHLQKIQFHESFKCGRGSDRGYSAVTVGAGIQWEELYRQAYQRKMILAGGGCSSVGAAGGYPQGGGQSFLSPLIGLSADNVLEYEVVTADGRLVKANACQNTDLFWALRGGGGGTFGVVLSATHRTFPALHTLVFAPHNFSAPDTTTFQGLLTLFTRLNPSLSDAGWSGYFFSTSQSLTLTFLLPNRNVSYASATLAPLLSYARENNIRIDGSLETYASYWDWHLQFQCGGQESCLGLNNLGVSDVFATRLIPRSLFNHEQDLLPKAMMRVMTELQVPATYAILGGGKVREPQDSAVNPAYRDGLWLLVSPLTWRDNATVAEMRAAANLVSQANKLFIDLTPGSGTYVNEADYNEPNWQQSFFGKNYPRLYHIKRRVDPINLFTCHHCVGSEFN
ncbi:hypothetical protein SELMODRAFT_115290 [Selaginella moellendorffii]|uniref:FAD-binding PCMH-type domain-containing protein n=1 Tax=Selaginella moellendorffii TaxID=88036 RepID=D8SFA1_SELML|nr:uncharacterized FAD-linked oxidoreductase ARB_02478 [Selaginella moellendorffii]XP_024542709.1 uncharacterized FAD-linked oxidoreductase ARB_02478 [Selaginella moellendorffii]XP_024542710.1 uncharacterized FAD-linked oxidoreductase ARB_02478 [Selaginella moellendorffii]EFJ17116.1 hypothetical protein SELMODRAFT_115290 [Selaginella moellendorffii]|eukprot:XP_002982023.1 uncharacterized FAD-linked oxidoreductase ARB_02478 [Selaginella moellendorffii]